MSEKLYRAKGPPEGGLTMVLTVIVWKAIAKLCSLKEARESCQGTQQTHIHTTHTVAMVTGSCGRFGDNY